MGTSSPGPVSTKLQRIAELASQSPQMVMTTLSHHIDLEFLHEAYRLTRKGGATGVDGQTAEEYATKLEANLQGLLDRFKTGTYRLFDCSRAFTIAFAVFCDRIFPMIPRSHGACCGLSVAFHDYLA